MNTIDMIESDGVINQVIIEIQNIFSKAMLNNPEKVFVLDVLKMAILLDSMETKK